VTLYNPSIAFLILGRSGLSLDKKILFFLLIAASFSFAEKKPKSVPFSVSSNQLQTTAPEMGAAVEGQSDIIARLKKEAIRQYFLSKVGEGKTGQLETLMDEDLIERSVLKYQVNSSATNKSLVEITGSLDVDALNSWLINHDAKTGSSDRSVRPLFAFSSQAPGYAVAPRDTALRSRDSALIQTLLSLVNGCFNNKFNTKLIIPESNPVYQGQPPTGKSQLSGLPSASSYSHLLWAHVGPCKRCPGTLSLSFYNLSTSRLIVLEGERIPIEVKDWGNADKWKSFLKPIAKDFCGKLDEQLSSGGLYANAYTLKVEGAGDNLRLTKQLDALLDEQDFLIDSTIKGFENGAQEFEVITNQSPQDLSQSLSAVHFPGFLLKPEGSSSTKVTVRIARE